MKIRKQVAHMKKQTTEKATSNVQYIQRNQGTILSYTIVARRLAGPFPPALPLPFLSAVGRDLDCLQWGICRSAAISLKVRPQVGQGTRLGSGVDTTSGSGPPVAIALPVAFPARMAARKASESAFHLGVLVEALL